MLKKNKRIAIMQPGYLPWLGFFELMHNCDVFVFLDDVQYTKRDWRSRNRIRTHNGWQWLSVPVFNRGKREQLIKDVQINNTVDWQKQHFNALKIHYGKSRYFKLYKDEIKNIYTQQWKSLLGLDIELISFLARKFSIETPCRLSSELKAGGRGSQRIVNICKRLEADELYDSKAAASFLDLSLFEKEKIKISFQNYSHPEYRQVYVPFIPQMSALDLLLNCGQSSREIILSGASFFRFEFVNGEKYAAI